MGPDGTGVRAAGSYHDQLVCTDSGWRIARRRYEMVHVGLVDAGFEI